MPPWISVFILFGALAGLILFFAFACYLARAFLARLASRTLDPTYLDTAPESEEVVARKMRQLDELAPAKTLKACNAENKDDAKQQQEAAAAAAAPQPTSVLVCAICLEPMEEQDIVRQLSCHHIYHSECIVRWYLTRHDTCPLCKTYYVPHEEVYITVPRDSFRRGFGARDDAILRYYQTMAV